MKNLYILLLACFMLMAAGTAQAVVINFDDLPLSQASVPNNYAGLTWGTVPVNYNGSIYTGEFVTWNDTGYSTPHSSQNYVYNQYGPDSLWFKFSTPVNFNGAWFALANTDESATEVRFLDDLGDSSDWLDLTNTSQFLAANFAGAQTIYVERRGKTGMNLPDYMQYYTMDDITYNESSPVPEPSTFILLGAGLGAVGFMRRRMKK